MGIRHLFLTVIFLSFLLVTTTFWGGLILFSGIDERIDALFHDHLPLLETLVIIETQHLKLNDWLKDIRELRQTRVDADLLLTMPDHLQSALQELARHQTLLEQKFLASQHSARLTSLEAPLFLSLSRLVKQEGHFLTLFSGKGERSLAGLPEGLISEMVLLNQEMLKHNREALDALRTEIQQREALTSSRLDAAQWWIIAIWLLLVLLAWAGVVLVQRRILGPLKVLTEAAGEIARGNLEISLGKSDHPRSTAELDHLRHAMRVMVEALKDHRHMEWMVRCSEKMSSIGRLAIGVAHEVNNPLANAAMNLQLLTMNLEGHPDAGVLLGRVEVIRRNVDKAVAIAKELLNFSKSDQMDFAHISLRDPIESALLLMEYEMQKVRLVREFTEDLEIKGIYGKLEQVFLNLFRNALDAMPDGGVLTVRTSHQGEWAVATVTDTGTGIPRELQKRILEPFVSTKKKGTGFGLGLPVCLSIVEQHGGQLEIASTPGEGTTVTIRISLPDS